VWKPSQKWSVQRSAVRSIAWLGVWCGFGFIVLRTACNRKLSVAVVDVNKTACTDAQLLCEPRLYDNDEVLSNDLADPTRERSQLVAAGCERNRERELAVHEFDWTFKRDCLRHDSDGNA